MIPTHRYHHLEEEPPREFADLLLAYAGGGPLRLTHETYVRHLPSVLRQGVTDGTGGDMGLFFSLGWLEEPTHVRPKRDAASPDRGVMVYLSVPLVALPGLDLVPDPNYYGALSDREGDDVAQLLREHPTLDGASVMTKRVHRLPRAWIDSWSDEMGNVTYV